MRRKVITILLLGVFAITVLPLRQVGRMLYDNQWTEELSEHAETKGKQQVGSYALHPFDFLNCSQHHTCNPAANLIYQTLYGQALPPNPAGEILVPPPNCA